MIGIPQRDLLETTDPTRLLEGARGAAHLAERIADAACEWAERGQAGFADASEARLAARLARSIVDVARSDESLSALRIVAADAWEAVRRAMAASQRVACAAPAARSETRFAA